MQIPEENRHQLRPAKMMRRDPVGQFALAAYQIHSAYICSIAT